MIRQLLDARRFHGWARIVALAFLSVNASGCIRRPTTGPLQEVRPWPSYLGSDTRAPSATKTLANDPTPKWRTKLHRAATGPPAVGAQVIAVQDVGRDAYLLAFDTGKRLWRAHLNAAGASGPLIVGRYVFSATAGHRGRVYALRLSTGGTAWRRDVGPVSGPLAFTDGRVYAVTELGRLVAIDTARGTIAWDRLLRGRVRSGVTAFGDAVLVATDDSLFVLDAATGTPRAQAAAPGAVLSPPAVVGDTVVYASPDGFVAAYDTALTRLWRVNVDGPIFGGAVVARDTAFAVTLDGGLWRIPLAEPDHPDTIALGVVVRAPPAPVRDGLLIATVGGEILLVRDRGAAPAFRLGVDGPVEQAPLVDRGSLLVLDGKGSVHAWQ